MLGSGLREVSNPSEILISHKDEAVRDTIALSGRDETTDD
jgi:predicted ATP-dependent serine protease